MPLPPCTIDLWQDNSFAFDFKHVNMNIVTENIYYCPELEVLQNYVHFFFSMVQSVDWIIFSVCQVLNAGLHVPKK